MPSTARRQPSDAELHARLSARIQVLEDRVRRLEAYVRRAVADARATPAVKRAARPVGPSKASRPRPRCPGCTLELPRGPRGESCAWCGFHLDAARTGRGASRGTPKR